MTTRKTRKFAMGGETDQGRLVAITAPVEPVMPSVGAKGKIPAGMPQNMRDFKAVLAKEAARRQLAGKGGSARPAAPAPSFKPDYTDPVPDLKGQYPTKGPTPMPVFGDAPSMTPDEIAKNKIELASKAAANPSAQPVDNRSQMAAQAAGLKQPIQPATPNMAPPAAMKRGGAVKAKPAGKSPAKEKPTAKGWGIARGARPAKMR